MAKNSGKIFEDNFRTSINKDEIYYLRLKDNPSSFGFVNPNIKFSLTNPYDCLCFYDGYLFPLELKTTKNNIFSIQCEKSEEKKMIKRHQIDGLSEAEKYKNVCAGFVFHFSDIENKENDKTYWLSIQNFNIFLNQTHKKTINQQDVTNYGGIEINKRLKKTNYEYDVLGLFKTLIQISQKGKVK